ncbi:hypothetical protein Tco_1294218 [Tanacetum coccineum]
MSLMKLPPKTATYGEIPLCIAHKLKGRSQFGAFKIGGFPVSPIFQCLESSNAVIRKKMNGVFFSRRGVIGREIFLRNPDNEPPGKKPAYRGKLLIPLTVVGMRTLTQSDFWEIIEDLFLDLEEGSGVHYSRLAYP